MKLNPTPQPPAAVHAPSATADARIAAHILAELARLRAPSKLSQSELPGEVLASNAQFFIQLDRLRAFSKDAATVLDTGDKDACRRLANARLDAALLSTKFRRLVGWARARVEEEDRAAAKAVQDEQARVALEAADKAARRQAWLKRQAEDAEFAAKELAAEEEA